MAANKNSDSDIGKDVTNPPEPTEEERREDPRPDQIGILPGKVPGRPVDPGDPRFPGSQPDLA